MSTGGPDLFVICKSCGSEVSPYITECPYCGNRLRKRAPKLDRDGRVAEKRRKRRTPAPSLPRLRRGEIPGIRAESRPYATIALVVARAGRLLLWRTSLLTLDDVAVIGKPGGDWWRVLTAPFVYNNTGYAFAALGAIAPVRLAARAPAWAVDRARAVRGRRDRRGRGHGRGYPIPIVARRQRRRAGA